jgi:hypothetical protein
MVLKIDNITQELIDKLNASTVDNNTCRGNDNVDIDWSMMGKDDQIQLAHIFENLGSILQELKDNMPDGSDF